MENFDLKKYLAENRLLKETKEMVYYYLLMDLGGTELAGDTFQDMMKKRNDFDSFEDFLNDEIDFFKQEGDIEVVNQIQSTFLNENNLDWKIKDDEGDREDMLMANIESSIDDLLSMAKEESYNIGGEFRGPGVWDRVKKLLKSKL